MSEQALQRRLTAILAADVVGYSRLMGADEAGTMAALKSRRTEILQPLVSRHHGRIIKVMGDGVLVEFASAVNAVECAIELQAGMEGANRNLPEDRRIVLRVGINLGDVMVEGSDLYGEGVNIAARLEAIADPGGIVISSTAHDYVRNRIKTSFDDMGAQTLKNIAEPIRAYRVAWTDAVAAMASQPVTGRPSIAVLPFANMSGDPEQAYFSDGVTEDIITEISRFRELFVIARNSSFQYRDKSIDVRRIGRELDVQYVVEGSVRKLGDRVRVTAQLIHAVTGNHLWAERYDRDLADVFTLQEDLAHAIAATIGGRVEAAARETYDAPQSGGPYSVRFRPSCQGPQLQVHSRRYDSGPRPIASGHQNRSHLCPGSRVLRGCLLHALDGVLDGRTRKDVSRCLSSRGTRCRPRRLRQRNSVHVGIHEGLCARLRTSTRSH
jgi:TolB-like protein/class 3 adenylate cyclase